MIHEIRKFGDQRPAFRGDNTPMLHPPLQGPNTAAPLRNHTKPEVQIDFPRPSSGEHTRFQELCKAFRCRDGMALNECARKIPDLLKKQAFNNNSKLREDGYTYSKFLEQLVFLDGRCPGRSIQQRGTTAQVYPYNDGPKLPFSNIKRGGRQVPAEPPNPPPIANLPPPRLEKNPLEPPPVQPSSAQEYLNRAPSNIKRGGRQVSTEPPNPPPLITNPPPPRLEDPSLRLPENPSEPPPVQPSPAVKKPRPKARRRSEPPAETYPPRPTALERETSSPRRNSETGMSSRKILGSILSLLAAVATGRVLLPPLSHPNRSAVGLQRALNSQGRGTLAPPPEKPKLKFAFSRKPEPNPTTNLPYPQNTGHPGE